jgi:hypothetical protein
MNRTARDSLTGKICSALVFGLLLGCVPTPKPPFDLSRLTPEKALDVIEWLGSLDLSQPEPVIQGLRLNLEFKKRTANLNGHNMPEVEEVYSGPVLNGSKTTLDYYVYDPRASAAAREPWLGGITRAFLRWNLFPLGHYSSVETCVRVQHLRNRFGSPVSEIVVPDGGGKSFQFYVRSLGTWRTYTAGLEDAAGCIHTLPVRQTDR